MRDWNGGIGHPRRPRRFLNLVAFGLIGRLMVWAVIDNQFYAQRLCLFHISHRNLRGNEDVVSESFQHGSNPFCSRPLIGLERVRRKHVSAREAAYRLKRSEEHTPELQSLMRNSYAVFCLKKK